MKRVQRKTECPAPTSRRLFQWLVLALALVLLLGVLYGWLSQTLPRKVISEISRLTNTHIGMTRLHAGLRGDVEIDNLVINPFQHTPSPHPLFSAKHVIIQFSWRSLFCFRPRIVHVDVRNFVANALYEPNTGRWNTSDLTRLPAGGKNSLQIPQIHLQNGLLRYARADGTDVNNVAVIPLDVDLTLSDPNTQAYHLVVKTGAVYRGLGQSILQGDWLPGHLVLTGGLSSQDTPALERVWTAPVIASELSYNDQGEYSFHLRIRNLTSTKSNPPKGRNVIESAIRPSNIAERIQRFFGRYQPTGRANITVDASGSLSQVMKSQITGTIECHDISLRDQKFPYQIDHIKGSVLFTQDGLVTTGLRGQHNDSEILIDFRTRGSGKQRQYEVHTISDNLQLDEDLYQALTEKQQRFWRLFNPTGTARMDYRLSRSSPTRYHHSLQVRLLGARAVYQGFPYPLEKLTGDLRFDPNGVTFKHITSVVEEGKIIADGKVTFQSHGPVDPNLQIQVVNIPFDETLALALTPRQQGLYRELKLNGCTDATIDVRGHTDPNVFAQVQAAIRAQKTSFRIPGIDATVTDANFAVTLSNQTLDIQAMTGLHGNSLVAVEGHVWQSTASTAPCYTLQIASEAYHLEDLVTILPPSVSEHVIQLGAQGTLALTGTLSRLEEANAPDYHFEAYCQNLRARPQAFPYPLKQITGNLSAKNGKLTLEQLTIVPDVNDASPKTAITVSGHLNWENEHCAASQLELSLQDIPINPILLRAFPSALHPTLESLAPQGRLTVNPGTVSLQPQGQQQLDVRVQAHAQLTYGSLHLLGSDARYGAQVDMDGTYRPGKGFQKGTIHWLSDHIQYKGKTLTNLWSRWDYHPATHSWKSPNLTGDFYEGHLISTVDLRLGASVPSRLESHFSVTDANLYRFLDDTEDNRPDGYEPSHGMFSASLSLGILPSDEVSPVGRCTLNLRDMQIGKKSPLSKIFSGLKITNPVDFTLDQMLIDAFIQGDQVLFDQCDMSGKALALCGTGTLDLTTNDVQLSLFTRGARQPATKPSLLQSLSEGLGNAVVRLEVRGQVTDPNITTQALPVFKDSLRLLGASD